MIVARFIAITSSARYWRDFSSARHTNTIVGKHDPAATPAGGNTDSLAGFTLLELLICLLIVTVLGIISIPGLHNLAERQRSDSIMRSLMDAIALGKTTAITTGEPVTLCRSRNGAECGGQWQEGVLLFTDANADRQVNQDDVVKRYFTFPDADGVLTWRAFQNRQYLQFTSAGHTRNQNGSFTYCSGNRKPELARQLIVSRTARARFAIDSDGDGIREDSEGKPIVCD